MLTGIHLNHAYGTALAACERRGDCATALNFANAFGAFPSNSELSLANGLAGLVFVVPGVLGMFWGAPLIAREFETGTFRLAWTQGTTRTRWLAVKLGVVGVASMAAAGLLSLMTSWWSSPIWTVNQNPFSHFHNGDIAPVGYVAFALGAAYQPASRYWPLQWYETGIYLALALALTGFCLWRIRPGRSAEPDLGRPRPSRPAPALQRSA